MSVTASIVRRSIAGTAAVFVTLALSLAVMACPCPWRMQNLNHFAHARELYFPVDDCAVLSSNGAVFVWTKGHRSSVSTVRLADFLEEATRESDESSRDEQGGMLMFHLSLKDAFQIFFWVAIVIMGIPAARKVAYEMRHTLRHQKAEIAMRLLDDFHSNEFALRAMEMLEPEGHHQFDDGFGWTFAVTPEDVRRALVTTSTHGKQADAKDIFIAKCFDYYFYYLDRIRYAIDIELINLDDVSALNYYMERLGTQKQAFLDRIRYLRWEKLPSFLDHFDPWRNAIADAANGDAATRGPPVNGGAQSAYTDLLLQKQKTWRTFSRIVWLIVAGIVMVLLILLAAFI